jgi:thiol-disulfide isomerase/thioredoxin
MRVKFFLLVASVLLSLACVALYLDYKFSAKPTLMQAEGGANTGVGVVTPASTADVSAGAIYALNKVDQFGKSQSFAQWSGKLLVINFWATWCTPCREEMPMFAQMQRTYALNGLQIIGIAADNATNVQSFSAKMKIDYPLFYLIKWVR